MRVLEKGSIIAQYDKISEYDISKGMRPLDFYIRSSDSKNDSAHSNKLIVIILFVGFVVSFIEGKKSSNGSLLEFVCMTDAKQF